MVRSMANKATMVLPAPVGAQIREFEFVWKIVSNTTDYGLGYRYGHHIVNI